MWNAFSPPICQSSYHSEPCSTATSSRKPSEVLRLDEMPRHSTTHSVSHFLADCFCPSQAASCFKAGSVCCLVVSPEPSPGQAGNSDRNENVHTGFTWVSTFSSNWSYNILHTPKEPLYPTAKKLLWFSYIFFIVPIACTQSEIWQLTSQVPYPLFPIP